MDDALETIITLCPVPPMPISTPLPPTSSHWRARAARAGETRETPHSSGEVRLDSLAFPERIGTFEVLRPLARGGMGMVYLAHDPRLNRLVALKMLRGNPAREEDFARLRAEAEAVARLRHPNIVQIHGVGEQDGLPFLVLEYVNGGSLSQRLLGPPLAPRDAVELVLPLARAMAHAHQVGILHRDLKPGNVLLQHALADGPQPPLARMIPKITDFGLARVPGHLGQTHSGIIVGTLHYMAPEQASGQTELFGPAMDIYALGVMLYEMLTGHLPFTGSDPMALLDRIRWQAPLAPSRLQPTLPKDLETICLKCLEKQPAERYVAADVLADDLQHFLDGEPILARPVSRLEAAWKWAKRFPSRAALIGVSLVAGLTLLGACMAAYHNAALAGANDRLEQALREAHEQRRRAELAEFRDVAENHLDALQKNLNGFLEIAYSLNAFVHSGREVSLDAFGRFAQAAVDRHDELLAVEWLPCVPLQERDTFEAKATGDGQPFRILERNPRGGFRPADARPDYFPAACRASHDPGGVLGLDHASLPERQHAMDRARDTGQPVATGLVPHFIGLPGQEQQLACVVYLPAYTLGSNPRTVPERRCRLRGFTAVFLDMPKLVRTAWTTVDGHAETDVSVLDITDSRPEVICQECGGAQRNGTVAPDRLRQEMLTRKPNWSREFRLLGRTWWIGCAKAAAQP